MRKKSYKVGTLLMSALMLASAPATVFAAEKPASVDYEDHQYDNPSVQAAEASLVIYDGSGDQTFTVTIPKKIVLGSDKTADYQITVKGDVATGSSVDVVPRDDVNDVDGINFKMTVDAGKKGDPVNANVTQAQTNWNYAAITANNGNGTAKTGNVNAPDLTKGSWSGNLTFDITFNDEYAD